MLPDDPDAYAGCDPFPGPDAYASRSLTDPVSDLDGLGLADPYGDRGTVAHADLPSPADPWHTDAHPDYDAILNRYTDSYWRDRAIADANRVRARQSTRAAWAHRLRDAVHTNAWIVGAGAVAYAARRLVRVATNRRRH